MPSCCPKEGFMRFVTHPGLAARLAVAAVAAALALLAATPAAANVPLTQVSSDNTTNTTSQHRTQVEPDTYTFGNTIVSAFQTGRFFDGGASAIGFATSTNGGSTWTTPVTIASVSKHYRRRWAAQRTAALR
jgi:hypothetical protein